MKAGTLSESGRIRPHLTPLECGIIFGGIPAGAISRKGGLIWGIPPRGLCPPNRPGFSCLRAAPAPRLAAGILRVSPIPGTRGSVHPTLSGTKLDSPRRCQPCCWSGCSRRGSCGHVVFYPHLPQQQKMPAGVLTKRAFLATRPAGVHRDSLTPGAESHCNCRRDPPCIPLWGSLEVPGCTSRSVGGSAARVHVSRGAGHR